jgi:hypothetical protein
LAMSWSSSRLLLSSSAMFIERSTRVIEGSPAW